MLVGKDKSKGTLRVRRHLRWIWVVYYRALLQPFVWLFWRFLFLRPLIRHVIKFSDGWHFYLRYGRLPHRKALLYNEYLFNLKHSRDFVSNLRACVTDKESVKDFISSILGADKTIKTLAVIKSKKDLKSFAAHKFPAVLKPTHSSGRFLLCESNHKIKESKNILLGWLAHDYFYHSLEFNYSGLEKKIIVEEFLSERFFLEGSVHCKNGIPKIVSLINRYTKERQSYSANKSPLGVSLSFALKDLKVRNWNFFNVLLGECKKLSKPFSYIRIDFYTDGDEIIYGELTNLPAGGNGIFFPENGEEIFSSEFFSDDFV